MQPQQPSDFEAQNTSPNPNPDPTPDLTPTPSEPVVSPVQNPTATSPVVAPVDAASSPTSIWPGAFGLYKTSKKAIRLNIGTVVCLLLATFAVSIVLDIFLNDELSFVGDIAAFIISSLFSAALTLAYLAGVRGQKLGFTQSVSQSVPFWVAMIALSILTSLLLGLSLVLLIVPFFFVFPRVVLAPYYLIDQKQGVIESLKSSWNTTKGHVGKVYGIVGANLAFGLLCVTIIGIPFAVYFFIMYSAATALLFEFINKRSNSPADPLI